MIKNLVDLLSQHFLGKDIICSFSQLYENFDGGSSYTRILQLTLIKKRL